MQDMKEFPIITVHGNEALISPPRLDRLRAGLRGALLCVGDPDLDGTPS
jgi:hypothetical protein